MSHLKRFYEFINNSDSDDILDILQDFAETKPNIWKHQFVEYTNGLLVVYFDNVDKMNQINFDEIGQRLESFEYKLVSFFEQSNDSVWFLIMSDDLYSKYRQMNFKFIEDFFNDNREFGHELIEYTTGDCIEITSTGDEVNIWSIIDGYVEKDSENRVCANIYLLESQHRISGIIKSLSVRGF